MTRFLLKVAICALLATAASVAYLSTQSGDPIYTLLEWISPARFQQYDALIRSVAAEHHLDPMLVKAVVWRESRFDAQKYGSAGERGLMQVSDRAAQEWALQNRIENFRVEELFDPKVNIEAGTWYLRRAMQHIATAQQRDIERCVRDDASTHASPHPHHDLTKMRAALLTRSTLRLIRSRLVMWWR